MIKLHHVRGSGAAGAAALGTNAVPNTTEPADALVVGTPVKNGHSLGGTVEAWAYAVGGASLTIETWVRVSELGPLATQEKGRWFLHIAAAVVSVDESAILGEVPPNCELFFRVTAGDSTQLGIQFV